MRQRRGLSRSTTGNQCMRTIFNLPFYEIFIGRPVNFAVFERSDQCGNRTIKHSFSLLFWVIKRAFNLSRGMNYCNISLPVIALFMLFSLIFSPVYAKNSPLSRQQSPKAKELTLQALRDFEENKWDEGQSLIAESKDPLAAKIYHWLLLGKTGNTEWNNQLFIKLSQFIRYNPEWPGIEGMKKRAEEVMPETLSNDEVVAWFENFLPKSFDGMCRYMDALIINGKRDQAKGVLAQWWSRSKISRTQQKRIIKDYRAYLTMDAHKKRFDTLLYNEEYNSALAMAKLIGHGYLALAKARKALAQNKGHGLAALIGKVPDKLKNDTGLLYERLRWRRKHNLDKGAVEILYQTPDADLIQNKDKWWAERHIIIRRLLERKKYQQAYELASSHIQDDGFSYTQAQWLAGWMALRFINKPTEAYERFSALYARVKTPVSKSRAAYWSGRAAQDMGNSNIARSWYKKASEYQMTYYGQLGRAELSMKDKLPNSKLPHISSDIRKLYETSDLIQASNLFKEVGNEEVSEKFINAFLKLDETPKAYRFIAERVADQGRYNLAVKIAKKAMRKGLFLTKQSYPTITKHLKKIHKVEWALVHAIIRQESMFNYKAKSPAGALGLMQIMPATARHITKKAGIPYSKGLLISNPKYNITLGSYYIGQMIRRYDGSYPLAIAAYNAGPGRVDKWIRIFGDPRTKEIDLIDWVELIPIYETRNYVQRVLEGTYVYRLRLRHIQKQPKAQLHIAVGKK